MHFSKREILFIMLAGFFITNAILGEIVGVKLVDFGFTQIPLGIIPWPLVFLTTDLLNEFYGKKAMRSLSFITTGLIGYLFLMLAISIALPTSKNSVVDSATFNAVFGTSQFIMIGSIIAFFTSQLLDITLFSFFKKITKGKYIWLRATGSTVISQLFDTIIVLGIAFYLPGKWTLGEFLHIARDSYFTKLIVAVALTPVIYLAHFAIKSLLKEKTPTIDPL